MNSTLNPTQILCLPIFSEAFLLLTLMLKIVWIQVWFEMLFQDYSIFYCAPCQNSFRCAKSRVRKKTKKIGLIKYFVDSDSESCSDVIMPNDFFLFSFLIFCEWCWQFYAFHLRRPTSHLELICAIHSLMYLANLKY